MSTELANEAAAARSRPSLKLLFAVKSIALSGGGAERVLAEVTAGLAARGHELVLVSFDKSNEEPFYRFAPAIRRLALGIGESSGRSGVRQTLRRIAALRSLAQAEAPDVAIGFMHSAYVPLGLGLAGTGIPVIASEHIVYSHYSDRPVERALLKIIPRFLYKVTGISEEMRRGFPSAMRRKMEIVPNPVAAASARADPVGGDTKILLSVGRLEEQKDHQTLIAAFSRLAEDFPQWRLRIVGEGFLRPELEEQVESLGVQGRVELPGAISDIRAEYSRAQLFAISSTYESFGLVTAEALAQGLPAVGFADCPGTNALIVDGENGLLVEGADRPAALAAGLRRLMASEAERKRMASRAPQGIEAFAPERIVDLWEALALSARREKGGAA